MNYVYDKKRIRKQGAGIKRFKSYERRAWTTLDKGKLQEIFGEDLKPFEKTTSYNVLRVK